MTRILFAWPLLVAVFVWALPSRAAEPACPPSGVHYALAENLERIDVALIGCARRTIDFAAYALTSFAVIDALRAAARRGVVVRLYADASPRALHAAALRLDNEPNVEIRRKASATLMHLKSYAVDGEVLRSGAANFSPGGLKRQDNDLVILRDPQALAGFAAMFETMWRR